MSDPKLLDSSILQSQLQNNNKLSKLVIRGDEYILYFYEEPTHFVTELRLH